MNITAITVSVNYSDYLKLSLEVNHKFFKKWYIITSADDLQTQNLCNNYSNVEVIIFNFKSYGKFNKGGALQYAQQIAHKKTPENLFLIIDSDIILPKSFAQEIQKLNIQENSIYGTIRRMVPSIQDYLNSDLQQFECQSWQRTYGKYCHVPLGFFQLYKTQHYYTKSNNAANCDHIFSHCFEHKVLISIIVDHIGPQGTNWNGRKSPTELY